MELFNTIVGKLAGLIWGPWIIFTLVGIGIYFSLGTGFIQVRKFGYILKETLGRMFDKEEDIEGEGTLTPFQAVTTALASTIGVGNIVGVATALVMGGPGAIFWMWVSAFFGMSTKYAEIVLSIAYREKTQDGSFIGGPAHYMKKGLNANILAVIFTVALALTCLGGNMVQANAISSNIESLFGINPYLSGIILVVLVSIVSIGGITRLGKVTEKLVPFMEVFYIIGGIIVVLLNVSQVPAAFALIFKSAFAPAAAGGGVAGYSMMIAMRYGISRGLYSNEAGQGTAPIVHATAKTTHAAKQGMWGVTEVFVDTFIVCTITALAIMLSGVIETGESPAVLASLAYGSVVPAFRYVVGISLIMFAYSTIITLSYYGESLSTFLGGEKWGKAYRYIYLPFTIIGAVGGLKMIWSIVDVLLGIGVVPNLIAIVLLSKKVFELTKDYFGSIDGTVKKRTV
jgi:AGCS family alanine or glycine:cation symporter